MTGRDRTRAAIHEAGHAVAAVIFGRRVSYATVRRSGDYAGLVKLAGPVHAFPLAVFAYAGVSAEITCLGPFTKVEHTVGAAGDFELVHLARRMGASTQVAAEVAMVICHNEEIKAAIHMVADMLRRPKPVRRIPGAEIEAAVVDHLQLHTDRVKRQRAATDLVAHLRNGGRP